MAYIVRPYGVMRPTQLTAVVSLAAFLMASAGCLRDPTPYEQRAAERRESAKDPESGRKSLTSSVVSVVEEGGQTLIELPIGEKHIVLVGTLFTVGDVQNPKAVKAILQVQTILGKERCYCRVLSVTDRQKPVTVGDPVKEILDIAELGSTRPGEPAVHSQAPDDQITALRRSYEANLATLKAEFETRLAQAETDKTAALNTKDEDAKRDRERLNAAHTAELAAVRSAMSAEMNAALTADRTIRAEEIKRLSAENAKLTAEYEKVLAQFGALQQQIVTVQSQKNALVERQKKELTAELETREVLQARITELSARLEGKKTLPVPVLAHDGRQETVLERLDRIMKEKHSLEMRVADLIAERTALQALSGATDGKDPVAKHIAELTKRAEEMERQRLDSERKYLDLVIQVLRLKSPEAGVQELQITLHRSLRPSVSASISSIQGP